MVINGNFHMLNYQRVTMIFYYHGSIGFFRLFFPGFIGRLDAQKGYDLLLESLVEVLEESNGTVGQWVL